MGGTRAKFYTRKRRPSETVCPWIATLVAALRRDFDVYVCTLGMTVPNSTGFGKW